MSGAEPQAPDIPVPPPTSAQPDPAQQVQQPAQPPQQGQQIMHINWSHFIQEFSRKPEEDAEAHLL